MSVLENFKNIPGRPTAATGLKCNFFSLNLQRSPWRKKKRGPVAPPKGDRPLSSPVGGGGDRVPSPYFKPWPPFAAIPFVI